MYIKTKQKLRR